MGWVVLLSSSFFLIELVSGWWLGSLALLADAGHMFADVFALLLAWFASKLANSRVSTQKTYGYYRLEILAAFLNGLLLCGLSVGIIWHAVDRFQSPPEIHGPWMLIVALGGLLVNLLSLRMLHQSKDENLNVKGAYLHIMGDLLGSVAAIVAASFIVSFGWYAADSVLSVLISVLVFWSAIRLLLEATDILLEASPKHISIEALTEFIAGLDGVVSVHDLHAWTITSGRYALSAHVVVREDAYQPATLQRIRDVVQDTFHLNHVTFQLETAELLQPSDGNKNSACKPFVHCTHPHS